MPIHSSFVRRLHPAPITLGLALAISACSKPEPPQLTPKEMKVASIDANGLGLVIRFDGYNPNKFPLITQKVTGKVVLDGSIELGQVDMQTPLTLAAGSRADLDVPIRVAWQNLAPVALLAAQKTTVPFTVQGSVAVGGEKLNVDVPFTMNGNLERKDLLDATARSLPAIPGFTLPAPQ